MPHPARSGCVAEGRWPALPRLDAETTRRRSSRGSPLVRSLVPRGEGRGLLHTLRARLVALGRVDPLEDLLTHPGRESVPVLARADMALERVEEIVGEHQRVAPIERCP